VLYPLGPYFPPEYDVPPAPPTPPPWSAHPGLLLLMIALGVVLALIVRDIVITHRRPGIRVVDELDIRWLPAEAAAMLAGDEEILPGSIDDRGRRTRSKRDTA
jgi:hypothetical protein